MEMVSVAIQEGILIDPCILTDIRISPFLDGSEVEHSLKPILIDEVAAECGHPSSRSGD